MEYKGRYEEGEIEKEKYHEFGAHFRYNDLVDVLQVLHEEQNMKQEKSNQDKSNMNSTNKNFDKVYNEINKHLCKKMTDIISPENFIQSRNIQPLIQTLSHKLTDMVQIQTNQKELKHNVTKKQCPNSNMSVKKKNKTILKKNIRLQKNNVSEMLNDVKKNNYVTKNSNINNNITNPKEALQSRNLNINTKKIVRKNLKNTQLSTFKSNKIISREIKNYTNTNEIIPEPDKNLSKINPKNLNNKIIIGSILSNSNNTDNDTTNKTVQNIIVKPNINISVINNFNTTFLNKSKHRQKKIRSRNNQELRNYSKLENKNINFNKKFEIKDDSNKMNENNKKKNNKVKIILLNDKNDIDFDPKIQPIVPKTKIKNTNSIPKSNIIQCKNKIVKLNDNLVNNFVKKEKKNDNNLQVNKIIKRINKNDYITLYSHSNIKNKINKTSSEAKHVSILTSKPNNNINKDNKVIDNNNINQGNNFESNNKNINNKSKENSLKKICFINSINEKKIKNRVLFTNKTILKKKIFIKK